MRDPEISRAYMFLPGALEHMGHGLHFMSVAAGMHHIAGEIGHAFHPHKGPYA